jgi:hypothetical protein
MSLEEKQELRHEPVPGYKTAFYIALGIAVGFLAIVFAMGLAGY